MSKKFCPYFLAGKCKKGDKCAWPHVARKTELCRAFAAGKCKFGDTCIYTHRVEGKKGDASPPSPAASAAVAAPEEAKAPPGEFAKKLVTVFERKATLRVVLSSRVPELSKASSKVLEYAEKQGWNVRPTDDPVIDHAFSHLCRERATLYVAQVALSDLQHARTLSIFGVQRDKRLLEVKVDPSKETTLSNTVTLGPNQFYPGDCTRAIERHDPVGVYDLVYAVDVYWNGTTDPLRPDSEGIRPRDYAKWCLWSRTRTIYIVTRMFRGDVGWDEQMVERPDGVWYRDEDGMIVFSPDRGNCAYPKHFDVNFLEYKAIAGLSIRHQATIGPYFVFAVHLDTTEVVPVAVHLTPIAAPIEWVVVAKPTLWGRVGCCSLPTPTFDFWLYEWFVRERRFLAHRQTAADLSVSNASRAPTGYVFDGVVSKAREAFASDIGFDELKRRFPTKYEEVLRGTAMASLYQNRRAVAHDMLHVRQDHGEAEAQLLIARNITPLQQTRSCCWQFFSVMAFLWLASVLFVYATSRVGVMAVNEMQQTAQAEELCLRHWAMYDFQYGNYPIPETVPSFSDALMCRRRLIRSMEEQQECFHVCQPLPYQIAMQQQLTGPLQGPRNGVAAAGKIVEDPYYLVLGTMLLFSGFLYLYGVGRRRVALFTMWLDARNEFPGMERGMSMSGYQVLCERDRVPPVEIQAMPNHVPRGKMRVIVDGKDMTPQQAFEVLRDTQPGSNFIWPILMTSGVMYAPSKNEVNLIFAAYARIHCPITSTSTAEQRRREWAHGGFIVRQLYKDANLAPPTLEECASVWSGAKAKVFLDTATRIEEGQHRPVIKKGVEYWTKKELNVKTNETIAAKGESVVKPRSIVVMGVEHHVLHAPWARAVAVYMHSKLDGQWHDLVYINAQGEMAHISIRIWFGSGLTGEELSEIGRAIELGDNVIAVAGDDIIMQINGVVYEGDLSACDQSHSEECVDECCTYYDQMGVPSHVVQDFKLSCIQPYVAMYKRVRIEGDPGCQLPTGSDWTTVDNTNAVLTLCLRAATCLPKDPSIVANEMGFKLKCQRHEHVCYATFLKGMFLPDRDGKLCWFNLPSMVAKIGKLQRNPKELGGVQICARAMALGMGAVPRDFPILGAAVAAMYRCGKDSKLRLNAGEDGWYKPTPTSNGIERNVALEVICRRYDISRLDVLRVEHLYDSIQQLPAFVMDPVFNVLTARDYE